MDLNIGEYDLETAAGKGIKVKLVHPGTGELLTDKGKHLVIEVYGKDSKQWKRAAKKIGRSLSVKYKKKVPPDAVEESLREQVAQCTFSFSDSIEWNGKKLECNPENALMLYKERTWIAEQLLDRATDRAELFLELGVN